MNKDYKFKIPEDIQRAIDFRQQNPEVVYSDTRTKELKEAQNRNRQINQNLDNYATSNFWTQPYQNLGSKSAINLGSNLVKESIYTGVGEAIGKIASYLTKLRKNSTTTFLRDLKQLDQKRGVEIDLLYQRKREAIDYITSPELRAKLRKIDKELGTSYEDALQMYLDNYKKGKPILNVVQDPKLEALGKSDHNIENIFDLDKQIIELGPNYNFATIEHEFKHFLEYLEAGISLKKRGYPVTMDNIKLFMETNPRQVQIFTNNFYTKEELYKNRPDLSREMLADDHDYFSRSSEANSQFSSFIKQRFINGKYTEPIKTVDELKELAGEVEKRGDFGPSRILYGLIKDKNKFREDFNNWMYMIPPIKNDNKD